MSPAARSGGSVALFPDTLGVVFHPASVDAICSIQLSRLVGAGLVIWNGMSLPFMSQVLPCNGVS